VPGDFLERERELLWVLHISDSGGWRLRHIIKDSQTFGILCHNGGSFFPKEAWVQQWLNLKFFGNPPEYSHV